MNPFSPTPAGGKTLACTQATGSVALSTVGKRVCVTNGGSSEVFIELGISTVEAAVNTGLYLGAGEKVLLTRNPDIQTHIAGICSTGETTSIYASTGEGDTLG